MIKKTLKNLDYKLIVIVLLLAAIGCIALYSAASGDVHRERIFKTIDVDWHRLCYNDNNINDKL